MVAKVSSFVLHGVEALPCEIEVRIERGAEPERVCVVGLPDAAVRESVERVRAAIEHAGFRFPHGRVTINLAPGSRRKEGPVYDLPIAIAVLVAIGALQLPDDGPRLDELLLAGELALDGRLRPVRGAISLAMLAAGGSATGVIVPRENAREAAAVGGIAVLGGTMLGEVAGFLAGRVAIPREPPIDVEALVAASRPEIDFAEVRGQEPAKRAIEIAAAGAHNLLMIGPAGTGKTMMARALPGILPPLSRDESLEVTRIWSAAGALAPGEGVVTMRPVRAPHHTATAAAIVGGGSVPRPGDASLAHRGVLFLDEVPEFPRDVLESLRQPLEDGFVTIARAQGSVRFPARFMLVGALNPTPRGDFARDAASQRTMDRYLDRLSGPLVDRVDVHVEVPRVPFRDLARGGRGADTASMRARVAAARERQAARQGATMNAELRGRALDAAVRLDERGAALLERAMRELELSARAYDKIRRVARTIADLDGEADVSAARVAEAIGYRLLDRIRRVG